MTVSAPTMAELIKRRDAVAAADIVELRLDSVTDPSVAGALAGRKQAVLVTCRPGWEGGGFTGSEEERLGILGSAAEAGAEFVDVEWRADHRALVSKAASRVVLSSHDFDAGLPADLLSRSRAMRSTGAAVVKIAVTPARLADTVALGRLGRTEGADGRLVVVGMGDYGTTTRVMPGRFSSRWTYAGFEKGIGQITPERLIEQYRFRALTEETAIYGITGRPVSHSVSPAMHNAAFRATGVDAVYLPLPACDAADFAAFADAFGLKGASVTVPFKMALAEKAQDVDATSRRIGAINTIKIDRGRWGATNTDAGGFLAPLREHIDGAGKSAPVRASILGAGGAARAAAIALASSGARVTIHARNPRQAEAVATTAGAHVGEWPPSPASWDVLVNCTPVGMFPNVDAAPLAAEQLSGGGGRLVYDLVYNPPVTRLLKYAQDAGLTAIGGLEMLVAQARAQFEWWTGIEAPAAVMRDAALAALAEFTNGHTR